MSELDEVGAHVGVRRMVMSGKTEDDASLRRRIEGAISLRQRRGESMPVAAPKALTPVQAAIKQTILDLTASRDDVPLEDILVALGTPAAEMGAMAPAVLPILLPILRRLALDGAISTKPDPRPHGKRPAGIHDPLEGNHILVSRVRPAPVAPKSHDAVDLLYDPTPGVGYIRCARLSYSGIAESVAAGTFVRVRVPGEMIDLDFDPTGHLVGLRLEDATNYLTPELLLTATVIEM